MDMLERLKSDLSKRFPLIWRHLCENEVLVESVFSQAFITLFIYYTEIKLAKRIFEIFLVGEWSVDLFRRGADDFQDDNEDVETESRQDPGHGYESAAPLLTLRYGDGMFDELQLEGACLL